MNVELVRMIIALLLLRLYSHGTNETSGEGGSRARAGPFLCYSMSCWFIMSLPSKLSREVQSLFIYAMYFAHRALQ